MEDLNERIAAWRAAKLLTDKQASAIAAFEAARAPEASVPEDASRVVLLAEALGSVGAAIAVTAVATLLGNQWHDFNLGGRLALVALLTAIVAGAGFALRGSSRAPMRRLVSLLLTAAILGVAWIVGIVANDALDWSSAAVMLSVGGSSLALSAMLYRWRKRALPNVAMLASALVIVGGLFAWPGLDPSPTWVGLSMWAVGAAWALLGLGHWIRPEGVAAGFGAVVALVAAQVSSFDDSRLAMLSVGFATAGAALAWGVARGATYLVTIGALGVLVLLPQFVTHIFGSTAAVLVTMLVVGLLLVVVSVRVARGRTAPVKKVAA